MIKRWLDLLTRSKKDSVSVMNGMLKLKDENSTDAGLAATEEMERVVKRILDRHHRELDKSALSAQH